MAPQPLLDDSKVSHLMCKGGAVNSAESGFPLSVVTSKIVVEALLSVYSQELTDDLDGQHFRVAKLGRRTALARRLLSLKPIVGHAENGDDEGAKIHYRDLLYACWLESPPNVTGVSAAPQLLRKTCTRG
jgi:hypothetical protein